MWQIINSGSQKAQDLMDLDASFLQTLTEPTLHFYRFSEPSLTYGLLMDPVDYLNLEALENKKITIAKRPTGGGALFHLWDMAFSVIIPVRFIAHIHATVDRYLLINTLTQKSLEPFLDQKLEKKLLDQTPLFTLGERFCMAKPTQYDVMIEGKKCVGAAQRVTKKTLLHQASISICACDTELLNEVLLDPTIALQMQEQSFYLSHFPYTDGLSLWQMQDKIQKSLQQTFNRYYNTVFEQKISPQDLTSM